MKAFLPQLRRHGPTVFGLVLLVAAVWVVQKEFRTLSVAQVTAAQSLTAPLTSTAAGRPARSMASSRRRVSAGERLCFAGEPQRRPHLTQPGQARPGQ